MVTSAEIINRQHKRTQEKLHPSRSLFEQFRDAATGVVPGIIHLVGTGAKEAVTKPFNVGSHLAHGDIAGAGRAVLTGLPTGGAVATIGGKLGLGGFTDEEAASVTPASHAAVESFQRTGGDILHPSRFAKAASEGRIVEKVLEDAGNVAIAAGAAGAPLRAGATALETSAPRLARGLQAAASGSETVAHLGGRVADLPIAPARWAGRRLLGVAADRLEQMGPEAMTAHGRYVEPVRRSVSRLVRSSVPRREGAAATAMADVARQTVAAEKAMPGAGEDMFTAARAKVMGLDLPIAQAVDAAFARPIANPEALVEQARRAVVGHDIAGHTVTPPAAQVLADSYAGKLAPETQAAFDELVAQMSTGEQQRRGRAESGYGFPEPGQALEGVHAGVGPVTSELDRLQARRVRTEQSTGRQVARAERRLRRAEGAVRVPEGTGAREVERTVLDTARLRRVGAPPETLPATGTFEARPALADLGVTTRPETLLRGVTRTARAQGEALGVAREAETMAGRGERAPSTTRITSDDIAQARQARLLRRTQVAAGAPAEALAPRQPAEGLLASMEPGARQFGAAATREAGTRAAVREARDRVSEQIRAMDTNPAEVQASARAARDSQVAELRSQADAVEARLRQVVDQTGPLDVRTGRHGAETRQASDLLGKRRLAITRYGQRLGVFSSEAAAAGRRPVGADVAAGIGETVGYGQLNPDQFYEQVFKDVEQAMNLRGQAGRIAKAAPSEELGQQILAELDSHARQQALGKAAAAFELDSAASVAATEGRVGYRSLQGDPGAQAAYQWLDAERSRAAAGARTGRAGAALDTGTARVFGRGVAEGQRVGRGDTLRTEGARLTGRADRLVEQARATGDLPEEMAQAQGRQAGQSFVAGQTAERRQAAARTASKELDAARSQRDVALRSVDAKIAHLVTAPETYPARWRPAMEANARWANHLRTSASSAGMDPVSATMLARMADEVPLLPADMSRAGMNPEHVQFGEVKPGSRQTAVSSGGVGPQRKLAAQYERAGDVAPMSPKNVAIVEGGEARRRESNEVIKTLITPQKVVDGQAQFDPVTNDPVGGYSRQVRSVLSDAELHDILDGVEQRVTTERVENRPAAIRQRLGEAITSKMAERGFEPWDPRSDSLLATPGMVNERTPFLPSGTADMVRRYWAPANHNAILAASTYLNSRWKGLVLPFSPRWQVGDMFGNYLMSLEGLGIDPITLTQRMKKAVGMMRADTLPAGLGEVGLAFSDAERLGLAERAAPRTRLGRGFRGLQEKSFHLNSFLNGAQRGAAYLELLDRNMKAGMVSEEAVAKAVRDANRTMGDFAAQTPFERRVISQVFPFYSWMRHITQLTGRLVVDHPERMVWTLHVGATYGNQENLPEWAKGGLRVGDAVIPATFLNPFADVTGGAGVPLTPSGRLGLANVGRSLSPVIKTGLAAGWGINPGRETLEATRAGQKGTDQYGRPVLEPLLGHPLELLGYAARQVPLLRTLQDVGPNVGLGGYSGGPKLRFDTGQTRTRKGRDIPSEGVIGGGSESRWDVLGRQFVPGFPDIVNPERDAAIAAARRRLARSR